MNPRITVLAGTNGAGKSSVGGAKLHRDQTKFYNPDEVARAYKKALDLSDENANSLAWKLGRDLLKTAIHNRRPFQFETTLGGNEIPSLLEGAATSGMEVAIWYAGLRDVELHIKRVKERFDAGGHDIPEETIRARYPRSIANLINLLPHLVELHVYDNSDETDPKRGVRPEPFLVLHMECGIIKGPPLSELSQVAQRAPWATNIIAAAKACHGSKTAPPENPTSDR